MQTGWCCTVAVLLIALANVIIRASAFVVEGSEDEEERARRFLKEYNDRAEEEFFNDNVAQWAYNTNVTDDNQAAASKADADLTAFSIEAAEAANKFNRSNIKDPIISRLIKKLSKVGIKLGPEDALKLSTITNNMTAIYSAGKICSKNNATGHKDCSVQWSLEPEINRILAKSHDWHLLKYVWKHWRDATGKKIKDLYRQFVELSNKGAKADGFADTGDWWRYGYEDPNFRDDVEKLWMEVLPLYEQLHTYVRRKLSNFYQGRFKSSTIPAHILGNMWSQTWGNVFNITAPYPDETAIDVSDEMIAQGYDALKMVHTSDDFFGSLGLHRMPKRFWEKSMFTKPTDGREVVCHASAWDFYNRKDFRIKMCTDVNQDDLITIHHEMGHIEYYLQYAAQPVVFREGANDGFHEAIGDTMALSSGTTKHLQLIGLLKNFVPSERQTINYLYQQALEKVAFLPFGYLIDNWRWQVFDGSSPFGSWNADWWRLRTKYQGIFPPVSRSEADFDPGAKFHIPANTPYLRYFISYIVQFQFYDALCNASGHQGPLHECDFYGSKEAGALLASVLKLGSSKPWQDAMEVFTGQRKMSAGSIKRYFAPLLDWLKTANEASQECYGWGEKWPEDVMKTLAQPRCSETIS